MAKGGPRRSHVVTYKACYCGLLLSALHKLLTQITLKLFCTLQDWLDIDFGIAEGVDFIAISFVKSAEVINHLKSYIKARARDRFDSISMFILFNSLLLFLNSSLAYLPCWSWILLYISFVF